MPTPKLILERLLNLLINLQKIWKNLEKNSKDFLMRRENLLCKSNKLRLLMINCLKTKQKLSKS